MYQKGNHSFKSGSLKKALDLWGLLSEAVLQQAFEYLYLHSMDFSIRLNSDTDSLCK